MKNNLFFTALLTLITSLSFAQKIEKQIKESEKVLVHIHASWCPTCKIQTKYLKKIDLKDVKLVEVDFDKDKDFIKKYDITQQSLFLTFYKGREISRKLGLLTQNKIENYISQSFSEDNLQLRINEKLSNSKIPTSIRAVMNNATKKLEASGILDKVTKTNDKYIDFSLENQKGEKTILSKELEHGPVVLTFYRGGWCPYCNLQLKAYSERIEDFKNKGAKLIAVTPDKLTELKKTTKKNDVKFTIVSDPNNKIARKYGLVFQLEEELKNIYLKFGLDLEKSQGNDSWELPIPATYVINRNGKIVYSFLNTDYTRRANVDEILEAIE